MKIISLVRLSIFYIALSPNNASESAHYSQLSFSPAEQNVFKTVRDAQNHLIEHRLEHLKATTAWEESLTTLLKRVENLLIDSSSSGSAHMFLWCVSFFHLKSRQTYEEIQDMSKQYIDIHNRLKSMIKAAKETKHILHSSSDSDKRNQSPPSASPIITDANLSIFQTYKSLGRQIYTEEQALYLRRIEIIKKYHSDLRASVHTLRRQNPFSLLLTLCNEEIEITNFELKDLINRTKSGTKTS